MAVRVLARGPAQLLLFECGAVVVALSSCLRRLSSWLILLLIDELVVDYVPDHIVIETLSGHCQIDVVFESTLSKFALVDRVAISVIHFCLFGSLGGWPAVSLEEVSVARGHVLGVLETDQAMRWRHAGRAPEALLLLLLCFLQVLVNVGVQQLLLQKLHHLF